MTAVVAGALIDRRETLTAPHLLVITRHDLILWSIFGLRDTFSLLVITLIPILWWFSSRPSHEV